MWIEYGRPWLWIGFGHGAGAVAHVAAGVVRRIAVEDLFVPALFRHAQPIAHARHGREVAGTTTKSLGIFRPADVAQRAVVVVVAVDPLEAVVVEIDFVQGLFAAIAGGSGRPRTSAVPGAIPTASGPIAGWCRSSTRSTGRSRCP